MKKFGVLVVLAMLTIPQLAHAQMWPRIQEALLSRKNLTPRQSIKSTDRDGHYD